jgi:heat shock protein HslJ
VFINTTQVLAIVSVMRHVLFSLSLAFLVAALTAACTQSITAPTSANAVTAPPSSAYTIAQLEGTWTLVSIHPAGGASQDRPFNSTYTITFSNGRLSTRADCNTCGAAFSMTGDVLTAGPNLACTRAACPTMEFESLYTSMLSGDSTTVVTNSTLTFTSSRGTLQFVRN